MTANVARLALPFTDADLHVHRNVRVYNADTPVYFTVTLDLPSDVVFGAPDGGYYNGGPLGAGTTAAYAPPDESLVMAFASAVAADPDGFGLAVAESAAQPGKYELTRVDGLAWQILWGDALTTMDPSWLGFLPTTYYSVASKISATYQSARLWRGSRPTWNRRKLRQLTTHAKTRSGGVATRQLSDTREEWDLRFAAQVGPKVYVHDGTIQPLVDMVPGMPLNDPHVALEALWMWAAARTPLQYWPDEATLATSEYCRPSSGDLLGGVENLIVSERSSTPPVYDLEMLLVRSTAGAAGVGGGAPVCNAPGIWYFDSMTAALTAYPTMVKGQVGVIRHNGVAVHSWIMSGTGTSLLHPGRGWWVPTELLEQDSYGFSLDSGTLISGANLGDRVVYDVTAGNAPAITWQFPGPGANGGFYRPSKLAVRWSATTTAPMDDGAGLVHLQVTREDNAQIYSGRATRIAGVWKAQVFDAAVLKYTDPFSFTDAQLVGGLLTDADLSDYMFGGNGGIKALAAYSISPRLIDPLPALTAQTAASFGRPASLTGDLKWRCELLSTHPGTGGDAEITISHVLVGPWLGTMEAP